MRFGWAKSLKACAFVIRAIIRAVSIQRIFGLAQKPTIVVIAMRKGEQDGTRTLAIMAAGLNETRRKIYVWSVKP